jgi:hypothetical protein|tara:strand:+ start:312 stop:887 length:576 start_codon:yes stop_codon:yes gene_type:complete
MAGDLSEKIKKRPHNQIFVFDDVISEELCEKFIQIIDTKAVDETITNPLTNVKCKSLCLNAKEEPKLYQKMVEIRTSLSDVMSGFGVYTLSDCGYVLRKIHGPTRLHVDSMLDFPGLPYFPRNQVRNLTMTIALNGDYDGGEFCFPCQNFKIKLKRGQIIAFPPFWTHPHYTNELHNDTYRYTINTWLHGN